MSNPSRCHRGVLCLFLILLFPGAGVSQQESPFPGRPRYPDGLLGLKAGVGVVKYLGEFTDQTVGGIFSLGAHYALFPEISLGLGTAFGNAYYHRRERRNTTTTYELQFARENNVLRSTTFSSFHLELLIHFFPRRFLNGYLLLGAGITFYDPEDYSSNQAALRPKQDNLASLSLPVGLGAEYFMARSLSITAEFRGQILFDDRFDAFPSGEVKETYGISGQTSTSESNDSYLSLTAGLRWYLFEDEDIDGDLLLNREEEQLGTNPYDIDTDGDGLTDFEEVRLYRCNPLLKDTDSDGLNDYVEIIKYRTDPNRVDTDGDGLGDGDEILMHHTNALNRDTDGDGLEDSEELEYACEPNRFDTDEDGLSDGEEIKSHKTNPLAKDTDGDGLGDFEEIMSHKTDPLNPDTDGDKLTDFDEIMTFGTNALLVDTDGDTLSDYDELKTRGTDPLKMDTDGDGFPDHLDVCPLNTEVYNGFQDEDGCPDVAPGTGIAAFPGTGAAPGRKGERPGNVDTVRMQVGGTITLFGVNFEVDKDIIRPESFAILEENAKLFQRYPSLEVEIRGHTDSDASEEYNLDLSRRRAQAVKRWLVTHGGVDARKLTMRGFGESRPVVPNTDAVSKARNRRIEFFVRKLDPDDLLNPVPDNTVRPKRVPSR